jgi:15-cis-phytoene synthase
MQDGFAYCVGLVRAADRDCYLATLYAPVELRGALHALYAFNIEIGRVREAAHQPMPGEIRLQWWREVIGGERAGQAQANPVAAALLATIERQRLPASALTTLIEAHRFDLYDAPMPTIADLEAYTADTSSTLFALAAQILGVNDEATAAPAGRAYGIAALLRDFPLHASRHQLYVPSELLDRFGVRTGEIFAGKSSAALNAALGELRDLARRHLREAHRQIIMLPPAVLPAFLPLALVEPMLRRLDRSDAFAPGELPLWRRQWLIWRAARNPAWIAS